MRSIAIFIVIAALASGCKDPLSTEPAPQPPQGLTALALSNQVQLMWYPSQIPYTIGYKVWVSDAYNGKYTLLGQTANNYFVDNGAVNGVLSYYAVSSYNDAGVESALTSDDVHAIPRPEGSNVVIPEYHISPAIAGYEFSSNTVGPYTDTHTDVYFGNASGLLLLEVPASTDIQDMGYTSNFDVIAAAPDTGWAPSGTAEAIPGHTYVIWTKNDHYAKMRVTSVSATSVAFDWAYQTVQGVVLLKRHPNARTSPAGAPTAVIPSVRH